MALPQLSVIFLSPEARVALVELKAVLVVLVDLARLFIILVKLITSSLLPEAAVERLVLMLVLLDLIQSMPMVEAQER
jgi:hypothetical protein